jgi:hypothetical protein
MSIATSSAAAAMHRSACILLTAHEPNRSRTFTIVYESFQNLPDPPYAFGYVLLDGADTALGGLSKGVDLSDPAAAAEKLAHG